MLVCLLSSPGTFSCFSVGVRGNRVYACVSQRSSSMLCACLLWLFWDAGRCSVYSYIEERWEGGRERENHEACKRWMCALITVMAIVAFHLLSLKHLVTPSSWWGRFLPRLITHMASRRYRACSEASSDTHVHTYACMYARTRTYSRTCTIAHTHACTYADTCTAPWQVAMTGHPAAMTRSGWIRTLLRCQERRAELS